MERNKCTALPGGPQTPLLHAQPAPQGTNEGFSIESSHLATSHQSQGHCYMIPSRAFLSKRFWLSAVAKQTASELSGFKTTTVSTMCCLP